MSKRINQLLNIIIGSAVGVFIGHGLYEYWHYRKYPDFLQSAPWYTSILLYGVFTLVVVAVCIMGKIILRKRMQRQNQNVRE